MLLKPLNGIFSYAISEVPFNLIKGVKPSLRAFLTTVLTEYSKSSIKLSLSLKKRFVFAILACCTLEKAPRPAVYKQAFSQPAFLAIGHT